jgi:hypothetical protein
MWMARPGGNAGRANNKLVLFPWQGNVGPSRRVCRTINILLEVGTNRRCEVMDRSERRGTAIEYQGGLTVYVDAHRLAMVRKEGVGSANHGISSNRNRRQALSHLLRFQLVLLEQLLVGFMMLPRLGRRSSIPVPRLQSGGGGRRRPLGSMGESPQHGANPIERRVDCGEVGGRDVAARPCDAQRRGEDAMDAIDNDAMARVDPACCVAPAAAAGVSCQRAVRVRHRARQALPTRHAAAPR